MPSDLCAQSNKRVWWRCEKGHEWQTSVQGRVVQNSRCPYCAGRKVMQGINDLATLFPEVAAEWDYEANEKSPEEYKPTCPDKVSWICGEGHRWEATIEKRTARKQGCPYCYGRAAIPGETDIATLNLFVMDCLRAVHTGTTKVGGLGYDKQGRDGCIVRGRGRNVSANRRKTGDDIGGYLSLSCMQNAMRTSKAAYDSLVRSLNFSQKAQKAQKEDATSIEELEAAYAVYKHSIPSERTMGRVPRFYALPESELSNDDMLYGVPREQAERELEKVLAGFTMPEGAGWFWQSENDKDLVVLRSWCSAA